MLKYRIFSTELTINVCVQLYTWEHYNDSLIIIIRLSSVFLTELCIMKAKESNRYSDNKVNLFSLCAIFRNN